VGQISNDHLGSLTLQLHTVGRDEVQKQEFAVNSGVLSGACLTRTSYLSVLNEGLSSGLCVALGFSYMRTYPTS
jgi:hypothetical protein